MRKLFLSLVLLLLSLVLLTGCIGIQNLDSESEFAQVGALVVKVAWVGTLTLKPQLKEVMHWSAETALTHAEAGNLRESLLRLTATLRNLGQDRYVPAAILALQALSDEPSLHPGAQKMLVRLCKDLMALSE